MLSVDCALNVDAVDDAGRQYAAENNNNFI